MDSDVEIARPLMPTETSRLNAEKRLGWAGFLSSIATSESVEHLVVEPLKEHFRDDPEIQEFIARQAEDEIRHYNMFSSYVLKHFQYKKTRKTLTDKIVYDRFLPMIAAYGKSRPLAILLVLQFYETFSIEIYRELKVIAANDGLGELIELIETVEKDEWRHLAGLKKMAKGPIPLRDRAIARLITLVLRFDVHAGRWAIHNQKLRKNLMRIGLDPAYVVGAARHAHLKTLEFANKRMT